mgnify:CR=1 FL=1
MKKSLIISTGILIPTLMLISQSAFADDGDNSVINRAYDFFTNTANGWTQFADDDAHIGPGGGGQRFDTEYLFYKYNETSKDLTIGLQTGFDVQDGEYNGYYAGDLALSFDGTTSGPLNGYEYAVDFGLLTKDYYNTNTVGGNTGVAGVDTAGLYQVSQWSNDIIYTASSPFAMETGALKTGLSENLTAAYDFTDGVNNAGIDSSFYRIVTFNLAGIVDTSNSFTVDAHWTMSCGNDTINGGFNIAGYTPPNGVPEPSALALFAIGSLGMGFMGIRRKKPTV